jgi:hypothetical protein
MSYNKRWYQARPVRIAAVVFLILVLIAPIIFTNVGLVPISPLASPTPNDLLSRALPEVPAGGTPMTVAGLYYHPTGIFAMPKLAEWNIPSDAPEEITAPNPNNNLSRVAALFSNSNAASVVHAIAELNPAFDFGAENALTNYYTDAVNALAWSRYSSWRESSRQVTDGTLSINFDLGFEQSNYLGRQLATIVRREGDYWVVILRIVVPANNPDLLTNLESVLWAGMRFLQTSLSAPLTWNTISDSGYILRYSPFWQKSGSAGQPYTLSGESNGRPLRLTARPVFGVKAEDDASARAWVAENYPRATIQSVLTLTRGGARGFAISFTDADADGNQRNNVLNLLNGFDGMYVANAQLGGPITDMLASGELPVDIGVAFNTFVISNAPQSNPAETEIAPTPAG